jgi:hypothetical protein
MKRPVLFLAALALAAPLFAVTGGTAPVAGSRIAVLRMSDRYSHGAEQTVARTVQNELREALVAHGFNAFDAKTTYDELSREDAGNADYYVEIVSGLATNGSHGGVGIGAGAVGAEISVVTAYVAAGVRLYDGKSLELIDSFDLHEDNTAVVPTMIGVGGRHIFAGIAIPFVQYAQYRRAARTVARQAATLIAGK